MPLSQLKNSFSRMRSEFKSLNSLLGSHMRSLGRSLNKISGRNPVNIRLPSAHASGSSPEQIASQLFSGAGKKALQSLLPNDNETSNAYNLSSNQMLSAAAAAISKAMKRNL